MEEDVRGIGVGQTDCCLCAQAFDGSASDQDSLAVHVLLQLFNDFDASRLTIEGLHCEGQVGQLEGKNPSLDKKDLVEWFGSQGICTRIVVFTGRRRIDTYTIPRVGFSIFSGGSSVPAFSLQNS